MIMYVLRPTSSQVHRSIPVPHEQVLPVIKLRAHLARRILITTVTKGPFRSSLAARPPLCPQQDHTEKSVPGVLKSKLA